MSQSPIDPPGHVRPLRLSTLTSAAFLHPETRRLVARFLMIMMLSITLLIAGVTARTSSLLPWVWLAILSMSLMFWAAMWILLVKTPEWRDRKRFPQEFRLAQDTRGYDLLRDGNVLAHRREQLADDGDSDHPIVSPDQTPIAWEEQLRLEHELRAQQDALLRELGTT